METANENREGTEMTAQQEIAEIERRLGRVEANDPARAGRQASERAALFGPHDRYNRYDLCALHTRFDSIAFIVRDRDDLDECGLPRVIRQSESAELALVGLDRSGVRA